MGARKGPTLRAQWLGKQLRELREGVKLTLKEAGDYIQRDQSSLSRMEQGITPMRVPDVLALLNLYGVSDPTVRDGLERLSRDIWRKGWWDDYARETSGKVIDHAWLEARAAEIRSFDVMVIPGLLQTPEYAEAVIKAADPAAARTYVARWVEFRMTRQQVLLDDEPVRLTVLLDEAVLCRTVGGPPVMRAQLEHLIEVAERPNITVQVLPFSAGAHAGHDGPFTIFDMPAPYPDVVYIETRAGGIYVESDSVEGFARAYDHLRQTALSAHESRALIVAAAERTT